MPTGRFGNPDLSISRPDRTATPVRHHLRLRRTVKTTSFREAREMAVELNHTIVAARDRRVAAEFLATTLGLRVGAPYGPFLPVETSNGVTLDFMDSDADEIASQHYAFLVSDEDFDAIFGRIQQAGIAFYADPGHQQAGRINHHDGGRGAYFEDPNGHNLEIITRPYGTGG
jgi:catechol 2,3-dioxygenase-like lactoylglutathione lyase family enzyme